MSGPQAPSICPLCAADLPSAHPLSGAPLHWGRIQLRLYMALARAAPRAVPLEALQRAVYGRSGITGNRLSANVTHLRRALEGAHMPWAIESILAPDHTAQAYRLAPASAKAALPGRGRGV